MQDYTALLRAAEVDQSILVADRELLRLYVPTVVMTQRGKKNATETAQENEKIFIARRHQPSAVERDINSLEPHGLNRCRDIGLAG